MTSSPPSSPTHKRRRTDHALETRCSSPASSLRNAVRAALVDATSPATRQSRINQVFDSYRQRAIQSARQQACEQHELKEQHLNQLQLSIHFRQPQPAQASPPVSPPPKPPPSAPDSQLSNRSPCHHHHDHRHDLHHDDGERDAHHCQHGKELSEGDCSNCETGNECVHNHASTCESSHEHCEQQLHEPAQDTTDSADNCDTADVATAPPGVFPGKGASKGCEHYSRNCWIKAACCDRYYACRRCHDECETHEIDRHATKFVACVNCGEKDQPVSEHCVTCGIKFAEYFCNICKFYDDRPGRCAYHCDKCGICRVGKGIGIDNYHCDLCGNCVPIEWKDNHPCRERSLDSNCPICTHHLATSTDQVVFLNCGHSMHVECLNQHAQTSYTCPICHKCLTDMSDWYKQLDEQLAQEVMPSEYANRVSRVLCYDCDQRSVVPFHFVYHKCGHDGCGAYNTRVLESFDRIVVGNDSGGETATTAASNRGETNTTTGVTGLTGAVATTGTTTQRGRDQQHSAMSSPDAVENGTRLALGPALGPALGSAHAGALAETKT